MKKETHYEIDSAKTALVTIQRDYNLNVKQKGQQRQERE